MSNLGGYQTIVEWSKKLGGPGRLVAALLATGAVGGVLINKTGEIIVKKGIQVVKRHKEKKKFSSVKAAVIYNVKTSYKLNELLEIKKGDQFKVLAVDSNAVLIELLGNDNNPYFVDGNLLRSISDFE